MTTPPGPHSAGGQGRPGRLWALLATTSADRAGAGSVRGEDAARRVMADLARVCEVAVAELAVSGAGVTVMGSVRAGLAGGRSLVYASTATSHVLEDLQLSTGEGPCLEAFATGAPVLVGDLAADEARWPGFAPAAVVAGAAAVFSFPLQVGAVRLGTLDLHRATRGTLGGAAVGDAVVLAQAATETLLEQVDAAPCRVVGWLADVHAEVHQASGMVSARCGVPMGAALLRIRGYAFTQGVPITEVARQIVERELVLDEDP